MSNKILHHLMLDTRISQTDLSKATGVPQPTISRILRGDTKSPKVSSIKKIAAHFGVTLRPTMNFLVKPVSYKT